MQNILPADIIRVTNKIVELIQANIVPFLEPNEVVDVRRAWAIQRDIGAIDNVKVDVYGSGYNISTPITRLEDSFDAFIIIAVMARYRDQVEEAEEPVPMAWVDELVGFVEQAIYNPLQEARVSFKTEDTDYEWRCTEADLTIACDASKLIQHKLFWSEMELGFNRLIVNQNV